MKDLLAAKYCGLISFITMKSVSTKIKTLPPTCVTSGNLIDFLESKHHDRSKLDKKLLQFHKTSWHYL